MQYCLQLLSNADVRAATACLAKQQAGTLHNLLHDVMSAWSKVHISSPMYADANELESTSYPKVDHMHHVATKANCRSQAHQSKLLAVGAWCGDVVSMSKVTQSRHCCWLPVKGESGLCLCLGCSLCRYVCLIVSVCLSVCMSVCVSVRLPSQSLIFVCI